MLGTYEPKLSDKADVANSFLVSSVAFAAIFALAVQVGSGVVKSKEKEVEVRFVEQVKLEPEPAPAPEPVKATPPPVATPVVPKHLKKIVVSKPIAPKKLVVPTKIDKGPLAEADPSQDKGVMVYGDGPADPAGMEGGYDVPQPLPPKAEPPKPLPGNRTPEFPALAKAEGRTDTVILKLVIGSNGLVLDVQVLRGSEPFVTAAVEAVKTWRYKPAQADGKPISVFHIVKIPFRIA